MLYDRHINALQRLVRHYQKGFVSFLYLDIEMKIIPSIFKFHKFASSINGHDLSLGFTSNYAIGVQSRVTGLYAYYIIVKYYKV